MVTEAVEDTPGVRAGRAHVLSPEALADAARPIWA